MPSVTDTMAAMLAMLDGGGAAWRLWLDRGVLGLCIASQAGLLAAFVVNLGRGSLDRAAVALFFFCGFFCVDYGMLTRGLRYAQLADSLTPLMAVGRSIEQDALRDDAPPDGQGMRRLRKLGRLMRPILVAVRWESPCVAVVLTIMFLVKGHHIIPNWPEGRGVTDPWEYVVLLAHLIIIAYGGRAFLLTCGLHWMSSLCVDCALHVLADHAAASATWPELERAVRLHQRLGDGFAKVQAFFADDLSLIVRIMLFFGTIGALRVAFGVLDVNNVVVLVIVFSYVATVCLTGELQEVAGDAFHRAACQCPWETWPVPHRRSYRMLLVGSVSPMQVRFRYFGPMRLDTLSSIANNLFKYVQVLRAGFGSGKWADE